MKRAHHDITLTMRQWRHDTLDRKMIAKYTADFVSKPIPSESEASPG